MAYPPGLIGVLSSDLSRWSWFAQSLLALQLPQDSHVAWCAGSWVAVAVNKLVAAMQPHHEWMSIFSDDHIFEPDLILRLLDHHLPLVFPLVALRRLPFAPSLFHEVEGGFRSYTWAELHGQQGLLPVDTLGGPCGIIGRAVIEQVGHPFFQNKPGELETPHEDLYTFSRCRQAGFQPTVDLDLHIGHCIPGAVFPTRTDEGYYGVKLWSYEELGTLFPQGVQAAHEYHAYT